MDSLPNAYDLSLIKFITLHNSKGLNEEMGYEGKFRKNAHDLEDILEKLNLDEIQILQLQLRRREKDFLMR